MEEIYTVQSYQGSLVGAYGLTRENFIKFKKSFKGENDLLNEIDSFELIRLCCKRGSFIDDDGICHYIDKMSDKELRQYIKNIFVTPFPFDDLIFFGDLETFHYEGYDKEIEDNYNIVVLKFNEDCTPFLGGE